MIHATIGWRTGQPTLKTMAGWTWDRVLERLKTIGDFLREKTEIDKQRIIAERELLGPDRLQHIGVRVVQDETFFVEPKITETSDHVTQEVA